MGLRRMNAWKNASVLLQNIVNCMFWIFCKAVLRNGAAEVTPLATPREVFLLIFFNLVFKWRTWIHV